MASKYAKSKCFIKNNGQYEEITYQELLQRCEADEAYRLRKFIPLYGMLLEVTPEEYIQFYRQQNRQKYLLRKAAENQDFSFDMLTTEDFNGADILIDPTQNVAEQAEHNLMVDKLRECLPMLKSEEWELIDALFFRELTEREYAAEKGIYHNAVHKRKRRILEKLKRFLES